MQAAPTVTFPVTHVMPSIEPPTLPTVETAESTIILFTFQGNIPVKLCEGEEIVIGRQHSTTVGYKLVDLTNYNGIACGVSRAHAMLRHKNGHWWVEDLGVRLAPRTPTMLKTNSELVLANMSVGLFIPDDYGGNSRAA
jgi:hypothetical protein